MQKLFVADYIRLKATFMRNTKKNGIWICTLKGLSGKIRTPSVARWKARGRLSIFHNWTFFRCLLRLRRYKRKCVKVGVYRRGGSLSANISGGSGQLPATLVVVERLEISAFRKGLRYWQIIISFCHNTRIWQTDRRTDRQTDGRTEKIARAIPCVALHADAQ